MTIEVSDITMKIFETYSHLRNEVLGEKVTVSEAKSVYVFLTDVIHLLQVKQKDRYITPKGTF